MNKQNYSNHIRFYAPHHFILLPLLLIHLGVGIWQVFSDDENQILWILFSTLIFLILFLTIMLRQHYALTIQDRLLRLEFKQRYFEIYGKRSDEVEKLLSFGQMAALRFAYDDEFIILLEDAVKNKTSAKEIKKSIKNWRPDLLRV
ncbi:hypothetical protein H1R16_00510 [Marnyiella aurantia]|uniref:Uncharacterized protein n=1 Tax=Marnyiella aurantia TaxID=2758037 RepID=A0A7D7QW56_9FLAO|nr:DUF6526 family protein [Marnyiella aurantia]MBA5246080.1 hypothetical protein [Marnyiella aurantia]QMS98530.1 hypothetical protein H1R16_00510 [Marnyiella aurantia]